LVLVESVAAELSQRAVRRARRRPPPGLAGNHRDVRRS